MSWKSTTITSTHNSNIETSIRKVETDIIEITKQTAQDIETSIRNLKIVQKKGQSLLGSYFRK